MISTATSIISRQEGDSLEGTDQAGQISLVDAARAAGVRHFILLSFPIVSVDFPLQQAKRAVEQRAVQSGMGYTLLRPTNFCESWLGPALGFDYAQRTVRILGSGHAAHAWISIMDVLQYTVACVDNPKVLGKTLDLGGPELLSQRDAVRIFEEESGAKFVLSEVPESALRAQYEQAAASFDKSFAGLMLGSALGTPIDDRLAREFLPIARTSVRDYARRVLGVSSRGGSTA